MAADVIVTISGADVDGMARQIAEHEGYEESALPMLREAVVSWFERIVEDTVTDRAFAMRHYGYRWNEALEAAERKVRQPPCGNRGLS